MTTHQHDDRNELIKDAIQLLIEFWQLANAGEPDMVQYVSSTVSKVRVGMHQMSEDDRTQQATGIMLHLMETIVVCAEFFGAKYQPPPTSKRRDDHARALAQAWAVLARGRAMLATYNVPIVPGMMVRGVRKITPAEIEATGAMHPGNHMGTPAVLDLSGVIVIPSGDEEGNTLGQLWFKDGGRVFSMG